MGRARRAREAARAAEVATAAQAHAETVGDQYLAAAYAVVERRSDTAALGNAEQRVRDRVTALAGSAALSQPLTYVYERSDGIWLLREQPPSDERDRLLAELRATQKAVLVVAFVRVTPQAVPEEARA